MKNGEAIIDIGFSTIVRECSLVPENNYYHYKNMNDSTYKIIHDIFCYRKFEEDFADFFTIYYKEGEVLGTFRPSYNEFLRKISYFLNTGIENPTDDEEFTKICDNRIKILENIKNENELAKEFPAIYQDLIAGRKYMYNVEESATTKEEYDELTHYFYSCALKKSFKNFIPTQVELYKRFVHRRKEYKDATLTKSANRYLKENFNIDKLTMLMIYKLIEKCEATDDIPTIKKYLPTISKYLFSDCNYCSSITTDEGYIITIEDIAFRYNSLQEKVKNINIIVGWEIAPAPQEEKLITVPAKNNRTKMSKEKVAKLRQIGKTKNELYQNSNYSAKAIGTMKNRGYVAYIYSNGEVILDREYDPEKVSTASGNAIYHMKAIDFETLSKLDKVELKHHPRVERIIHSKNWQQKVQAIIDKKGTVADREAAKTLIKRIKQKE